MAGATATARIFGAFVKILPFRKSPFFNKLAPPKRLGQREFEVTNRLCAGTYSWQEWVSHQNSLDSLIE